MNNIEIGSWKNSIDVIISTKISIDYVDLYLIFKFYIFINKMPLKYIYLMSYDKHNDYTKIICYEKIQIKKIKNLSVVLFREEIENIIDYSWKYVEDKKSFGFRFVFTDLIKEFNYSELIPKRPWNEDYMKLIDYDEYNRYDLKKKYAKMEEKYNTLKINNENLKKDNENLKSDIIYLKKIIEDFKK